MNMSAHCRDGPGLRAELLAEHGFHRNPRELMMDDLRKEQLELRVAQLQGSMNAGNDGLLERGRWLLDRGRPTEALVPLEELLQLSRDPRTVAEVRELIHRARLRRALDWAAAMPNPDVPAALAELDLIAVTSSTPSPLRRK